MIPVSWIRSKGAERRVDSWKFGHRIGDGGTVTLRKTRIFESCTQQLPRMQSPLALFALATSDDAMHKEPAFQASSPKTSGRPSGRPFFHPASFFWRRRWTDEPSPSAS